MRAILPPTMALTDNDNNIKSIFFSLTSESGVCIAVAIELSFAHDSRQNKASQYFAINRWI